MRVFHVDWYKSIIRIKILCAAITTACDIYDELYSSAQRDESQCTTVLQLIKSLIDQLTNFISKLWVPEEKETM